MPEGSSLLNTAGMLAWLVLEILVSLIHSPPFDLIKFKVFTFENTVSFYDKYGKEEENL